VKTKLDDGVGKVGWEIMKRKRDGTKNYTIQSSMEKNPVGQPRAASKF